MIKRRSRPQPNVREKSLDREEPPSTHVSEPDHDDGDEDEDKSLPCVFPRLCDIHIRIHLTSDRLSELLELRRLRKARQGIDVHKLSSGDVKKKRRRNAEEAAEEQGGLRPGAGSGSGSGAGAAAGAGPGAKTEDE